MAFAPRSNDQGGIPQGKRRPIRPTRAPAPTRSQTSTVAPKGPKARANPNTTTAVGTYAVEMTLEQARMMLAWDDFPPTNLELDALIVNQLVMQLPATYQGGAPVYQTGAILLDKMAIEQLVTTTQVQWDSQLSKFDAATVRLELIQI